MLDWQILREKTAEVIAMLERRGTAFDIAGLLSLDERRRGLRREVESLRNERNEKSKALGKLKQAGQDISQAGAEVKAMGDRLSSIEAELTVVEKDAEFQAHFLPNIPDASVPAGRSSVDNPVVRTWGDKRSFSFQPKEHAALGEALGILDFERAARISGARFSLSLGAGAHLERALINFMLDIHTREHGYLEVIPPFLVNETSLTATGNLPKFKDDVFCVASHGLYLIPTAEVPVTNIHQDEILAESDLPKAYVAYSPCFRSEAGTYGKDTHGLIRQHQFNKVEIVRFALPENSHAEHEKLTGHAEEILKRLDLPYRVVTLCTGDMGFSAQKTYDLEVWLPGQNAYREISSCSNFGDFQARRAKIRCKPKSGGKPRLVHTLNGSGLAVGRTVVAILENYQEADGSVAIPKALRPYLNGMERISKK